MKYENPTWEPAFYCVSPVIAWMYFNTNNGRIRRFLAKLIFWKMGRIEMKLEKKGNRAK